MLSANTLLSSTDVTKVLGLSREGLRQLRQRDAAPPAIRVGSVAVTPLDAFVDWVAKELARACRPRWMRKLRKAA
jgi:hypothetical protein